MLLFFHHHKFCPLRFSFAAYLFQWSQKRWEGSLSLCHIMYEHVGCRVAFSKSFTLLWAGINMSQFAPIQLQVIFDRTMAVFTDLGQVLVKPKTMKICFTATSYWSIITWFHKSIFGDVNREESNRNMRPDINRVSTYRFCRHPHLSSTFSSLTLFLFSDNVRSHATETTSKV